MNGRMRMVISDPVYGHQWRSWPTQDGGEVDQLSNVIERIKTDPDCRRLVVSAWNVGEIPKMALPPCHAFLQVLCRRWEIVLSALSALRRYIPRACHLTLLLIHCSPLWWRKCAVSSPVILCILLVMRTFTPITLSKRNTADAWISIPLLKCILTRM